MREGDSVVIKQRRCRGDGGADRVPVVELEPTCGANVINVNLNGRLHEATPFFFFCFFACKLLGFSREKVAPSSSLTPLAESGWGRTAA